MSNKKDASPLYRPLVPKVVVPQQAGIKSRNSKLPELIVRYKKQMPLVYARRNNFTFENPRKLIKYSLTRSPDFRYRDSPLTNADLVALAASTQPAEFESKVSARRKSNKLQESKELDVIESAAQDTTEQDSLPRETPTFKQVVLQKNAALLKEKIMLRDQGTPEFTTPESVQEIDQMKPLPLESLLKRVSSKTLEERVQTQNSDILLSPVHSKRLLSKKSLKFLPRIGRAKQAESQKVKSKSLNPSPSHKSSRNLDFSNRASLQNPLQISSMLSGRKNQSISPQRFETINDDESAQVYIEEQKSANFKFNTNDSIESLVMIDQSSKHPFEALRSELFQALLRERRHPEFRDKEPVKTDFIDYMRYNSRKSLLKSSLSKQQIANPLKRENSFVSLDKTSNLSSRVNLGSIKLAKIGGMGGGVSGDMRTHDNYSRASRYLSSSLAGRELSEICSKVHEKGERIEISLERDNTKIRALDQDKREKRVKRLSRVFDAHKTSEERRVAQRFTVLHPLQSLKVKNKAIHSLIEPKQLDSLKILGRLADPLNERDIENRHSIADIEKMLFESKLGSQRIHRPQRKKVPKVALDPIKKLRNELSIPRDMRRDMLEQRNLIPRKEHKFKVQKTQFFNMGVVDKNMELLNRALPHYSSIH